MLYIINLDRIPSNLESELGKYILFVLQNFKFFSFIFTEQQIFFFIFDNCPFLVYPNSIQHQSICRRIVKFYFIFGQKNKRRLAHFINPYLMSNSIQLTGDVNKKELLRRSQLNDFQRITFEAKRRGRWHVVRYTFFESSFKIET